MPIRNNPTLGHTICSECGEVATVHQQARGSGRFLYTRGCDCKYRNSTGQVFQSRLWDETDWLPEAEPARPPNLAERPAVTPEAYEQTESDGDEPVPGDEHEVDGVKTVSGWMVAGLSLVGGIALFVLSGGRRNS